MGMRKNMTKRAALLSLAFLLCSAGILTGCGREESYSAAKTNTDVSTAEFMPDLTPEPVPESEEKVSGALRAPESETDKLVYSGSVRLQTLEYEKTMKSIHARIEDAGGFVQYEDETDGNDSWYYNSSSASRRCAQIEARSVKKCFFCLSSL